MDEEYKKGLEMQQPHLLELIPRSGGWRGGGGSNRDMVGDCIIGSSNNGFKEAEERKLELRLGPPGGEEEELWSGSSLGYTSNFSTVHSSNPDFRQGHERKASGPSKMQANNSSKTRPVTTPVVGWPPVRSFRKNLACSSKPSLQSHQNGSSDPAAEVENGKKGLLVKINMDGIPIGRKVDLKAYDSYDKLTLAVDQLFGGLLAAQRDPIVAATQKNEEKQAITGLLDGSGEYTLVYEDDEGDRMLVGDVPWDMFISTAKRLRVLKSSDLAATKLRTMNRKRAAAEC